jgi:predicted DNA binding CopG/RHH family protein
MSEPELGNMAIIRNFDDVPAFTSESEEAAFWATHELGDEILAQMTAVSEDVLPRPRTRPIPVRFDEDTLRRVKALAARRHKGYQTLLKEFVIERLYEEEKREGLVG